MSDVYDIWLHPLVYRIGGEQSMKCQISCPQDGWEISFFALCLLLKEGHIQYMCSSLVPRPHPFGRGLGTRLHVQWPMCRDVVCWLFNRICKRYAHANVLPKNIMHTNPCKCWQYLTGMRYRGNKVGGCDCLAPPTSLSSPNTWIPIGPNETTVTLFWQHYAMKRRTSILLALVCSVFFISVKGKSVSVLVSRKSEIFATSVSKLS